MVSVERAERVQVSGDEIAQRSASNNKFIDQATTLRHPWIVRGVVEHGDKRGRTIGFPTANIHPGDEDLLAFGIYAVRTKILGYGNVVVASHEGVASFGVRPMFRTTKPILEVHLFDFSGYLYGKELIVEFVSWMRGEEKFDCLDALVAQIKADASAARAILRRTP